MAFFNFLQRRREREAAIPGGLPTGEDESLGTPLAESTSVAPAPAEVTSTQAEGSGLESLGALGKILGQAMTGNPSVIVSGESQVMDLQGSSDDLRASILETLKTHGIDAEKGQAVELNDPEVAQEIMRKLSALGLDPAHFGGPAAFGLPEEGQNPRAGDA